jgi:hypothetical protein
MLMKNLLNIFRKTNLFVVFFLITGILFFNPSFIALGQEESNSSDWSSVYVIEELSSIDGVSLDTIDNLLFVSDDCEGCENLYEYFKNTTFSSLDFSLLNISEVSNSTDVLQDAFDSCPLEGEIGTPFLFTESECFLGYTAVREKITAMQLAVSAENGSSSYDFISAAEESEKIDSYINGSITDKLADTTEVLEWYALAFIFVLAFGFLIYWLFKRKTLSQRGRKMFSVMQVILFVFPTLYLGYKVNYAVNLGNEYSSAAEANCAVTNTCATWADLMEARAEYAKSDPTYANSTIGKQATGYVRDNGGSGSAQYEALKNDQKEQVDAASEALLKAAGDDAIGSNGEILWDSINVQENSAVVASVQNGDIEVTYMNGIGDLVSYTVSVIDANTISPEATYIAQVQNILRSNEFTQSSTSGLTDVNVCLGGFGSESGLPSIVSACEKSLSAYNGFTLLTCEDNYSSCYLDDGVTARNIYYIDSNSGQVISTPVTVSVDSDFCETTEESVGDNSTVGEYLCKCENELGGYAYTRSDISDCSLVCEVRFPCETCNPEEPVQPYSPTPEDPTAPYCGDGILGNTTEEECEYGDPNGVSCSWNTCNSDCTCLEIDEPYCGDGILGNTEGEECEIGDPNGYSCTWDNCNHVTCKCVEPGCGDGVLDEGEQCERNDPDGLTCLWDSECNQLSCSCLEEPEPTCGDGNLDDGEFCEEGDPDGVSCSWNSCSKVSCTCPTDEPTNPTPSVPDTGIDDISTKIILGSVFLILGVIFSKYSLSIKDRVLYLRKRNLEKKF